MVRFFHAEHYFVSGVAETMLVFPVVVRVSECGPVEFQFKVNPIDGLNKGISVQSKSKDGLNKGCF